jgi:hypothetical protein
MTHAATEKPSRSRQAWPNAEEPEYASVLHSHDMPPWLRRAMLAIGGLMLLFSVGLGCLTYYVYLDHEYVQGRGQFRDAEAIRVQARTTEQIRQAMCDLLGGLPAGPLLDPKRTEYDCGPGVPYDELPPEQQDQLQQFSNEAPESTQAPMVRPLPSAPAEPSQEPPAPPTPATSTPVPSVAPTAGLPPVAPAAPTTAPPLVDLNPVTDAVCNALGVCI